MIEVTVKVPKEIGEMVSGIGETLYVEALKEAAGKRLSYSQKHLDDLKRRILVYESGYGKSYQEFSRNVPDTAEGHDDWIEWSYLDSVSAGVSKKIEKLRMITGK